MATILNLLAGLLAIGAIGGLGRLSIRPLPPMAAHWYAAIAMLAGFALSSVSVQCLAMAGSEPGGFRMLGAGIAIIGMAGHRAGRNRYIPIARPKAGWLLIPAFGLLGLTLAVLAAISMAPSSKIDELYYHMLVGRRILEDHGLRVYQFPLAQAMVPQMGYQIAQTIFQAAGTPDAGNILSLGFGMVLWFLIYGAVTETTQSPEAGLAAALCSAVGLYPAVWYVTAGPHALGDLAAFTGLAALFFPPDGGQPADPMRDKTRSFACVLGAVCAASAKISMWPVAAMMTAAAVIRLRGAARAQMGAVAAGLWFFVIGPLVLWTYVHTGSPLGAAFAPLFRHTAYEPAVQAAIEDARMNDRVGWGVAAWSATLFLNGGSLALILCGVVTCCRRKRYAGLLLLAAVQAALIAALLPNDFRFLGGLEWGLLAAGAAGIVSVWPARVPLKWAAGACVFLLGPWAAAELYYARPFLKGFSAAARERFLNRYVAFMDDFGALDKILPRDARLYVTDHRMPAFYASRPVIFSLADWDKKAPLYKFSKAPAAGDLPAPEPGLVCGEAVYRNPAAIVATFRTPNRLPEREAVVAQRCAAE